ncbi:hypothetical protein ASPZODRAFT_917591 [Penicilliopsis zonata CBS 506.65]|uniref:F-box domain-containing protein n=1 Tax=Penicilliopsis zonata CBS 506.65 TaxID=1073090 RepID=A0A1L9S841_9EURO|nr:hypothetical protein ASPZODRAFT_917591 [Penicilliopsis zonata CBS 506.65]OJJ43329.1 hypothetical protein ASPZODRAFT_917591 [Penicilliopsis zonata CBS 506.65]
MIPPLQGLPDEILYIILCHCHPCSTVSLEQTARRFSTITREPLLWRFYCQSHFKFWDSRHDIDEKLNCPASSIDWKELFIARYHIDRETTQVLNSILANQTGRIRKFHTITSFGYDAKDTLLTHIHSESEEEDYLARRYYAQALLSCLHRSTAIPEWSRLRNGEDVSLEQALGAFDLFLPESGFDDLKQITSNLDDIVTQFQRAYPDVRYFTPRQKALSLALYLRISNLTGIDPGRDYHRLDHNFLGIALTDPGHNSLPLISAAIYCYVAQCVGLKAHPCGFPFHVHVILRPPPGIDMDGNLLDEGDIGDPMYMDPFRSDKETPASDLQRQLSFLGASSNEQSVFLQESLPSEIILRCGRNILNSIHHNSEAPDLHLATVDLVSAKYSALWASILLANEPRSIVLRDYLPWLMEVFATDFTCDLYLIEQYIVPLFQDMPEYEHILDSLHVMRTVDERSKQIHQRSEEHNNVNYRVGQVFRHRRYNYRAIIIGWDSECGADEQWMRQMGIDRLQAGRHQSFYHALVEDKTFRYVAEENIEIITPHVTDLPQLLVSAAGKYFKRWDQTTRTFISNIKDEYPDD